MILDFLGGARTAVIVAGLLRIDHSHARQRFGVPEIRLVLEVPGVKLFDHRQPALVMQRAGELGEPGAQIVGDSVNGPEADLVAILDRILPAILLFYSNTEASDR